MKRNTSKTVGDQYLDEKDTRKKFITPAIRKAGWSLEQIGEEIRFTEGEIQVRGKLVSRGDAKQADYVLYYKPNIPLAVVEAKSNKFNVGDGIQQALGYAETLDIQYVFSSNGDGFVFHDRTGARKPMESNLKLEEFPSPRELWNSYSNWKDLSPEAQKIVLQDYYEDGSGKMPRYYQMSAINATMEAIANGQKRILLVMATGTGKTYTAFQIIWRLWKAKRKKRILFLADRNVLVDQTKVNDFQPFGEAMVKLSTRSKTIEKGKDGEVQIDTSSHVYLSLYQAITGSKEHDKTFRLFSREFFDLIVIDECHRGSASKDSLWHEILEYFSSATQIGLTATPRETKYESNIGYFGTPLYTYSLKQGIQDGFLAPYRVVRVHIDLDIEGYRPEEGKVDQGGDLVEDRHYSSREFDRDLVIDERTKLVASKITAFLKGSGNRFQKSIIFCVDQEHASRMRQALINENADLCTSNSHYVMRITSHDDIGQQQLGNFMDPESHFPVLVTTSRLLSTGVDVQTCRLIVLDRDIGSMTEFKQIIGRGTRVHEATNKLFFTLIDFRGATSHFSDPDFDGDPVQIYDPKDDEPIHPPHWESIDEEASKLDQGDDEPADGVDNDSTDVTPRKKIYIDGVDVSIIAERVKYLNKDGKLITESLKDFTKRELLKQFVSIDDFLNRWNQEKRKQVVLDEIERAGLPLDTVAKELAMDFDPFDLVCHIAFDVHPLTRHERAESLRRQNKFAEYSGTARKVLDALLDKYADEGILHLNDVQLLKIPPLNNIGTPLELIDAFGDKSSFEDAVAILQSSLYQQAA